MDGSQAEVLMPDTVPPCSVWPLGNKGDAEKAANRHKGTLLTVKKDDRDLGYVVQLSSGRKVGPKECYDLDRNTAR